MTNSTSYDCVPLNGNSYYQLFIYPCSAGKSDNFPIPIPMIASLYIHVFLGKGVAPREACLPIVDVPVHIVIGTPMALAMGMPVAITMGTKNAHIIGMPMPLVMGVPVAITMGTKKYVMVVHMPLVMGMPVAFIMGMKKKHIWIWGDLFRYVLCATV